MGLYIYISVQFGPSIFEGFHVQAVPSMGNFCLKTLVECLDDFVEASRPFLAHMRFRLSACVGRTAFLSEMPVALATPLQRTSWGE